MVEIKNLYMCRHCRSFYENKNKALNCVDICRNRIIRTISKNEIDFFKIKIIQFKGLIEGDETPK